MLLVFWILLPSSVYFHAELVVQTNSDFCFHYVMRAS